MQQAPLRVVFMGTPDFAVPSLQTLIDHPEVATVVTVFTQPDRPAGRGQQLHKPPIKELAEKYGIPVHQPEKLNTQPINRQLADCFADIFVIVAYSHFLSNAVLNIPRLGCVNVHSSLLPKYRGAAPIHWAILKGDNETGVSTIKLVEKMDAGPVLMQRSVPIPEDMTLSDLHDSLSKVGANLLIDTLIQMQNRTVIEKDQDETQVSYAPKIRKSDGVLNWDEQGIDIIRKIRAFKPWPGTFVHSTEGIFKVHKAEFHKAFSGAPYNLVPGEYYSKTGSFLVRCKDGWIELLEVQPEGKKIMLVHEFMNGIQNHQNFSFLSKP